MFLGVIRNIFKIEALCKKLLYTFLVLMVFRFGKHVPLPGIDINFLNSVEGHIGQEGFLAYLNMMSGGALGQCGIFTIGISPYITASIGMQFLVLAFPYLESLSKEGESGRNVINQYTRYLALFMSFFQGMGFVTLLEKGFLGNGLILNPGWHFRISSVLILSAGAIFVMWLGEQITKNGIGQGASVLIFSSIVASLPSSIIRIMNNVFFGETNLLFVAFISAFAVALIASIVFVEKGERRVPVCYAKKVSGRSSGGFGGVTSYMPLKINSAGVMPVILAMPAISIFTSGFKYIAAHLASYSFFDQLNLLHVFDYGTIGYSVLVAVFIVWFNFAYTSIIFNPEDLADNLRKSGGFIPGIRPGHKTAMFFEYLLNRINVSGAAYMTILAVMPFWVLYFSASPVSFSGLSVLISVGVALEIASQVESYLIENRYDGFLKK